MSGKSNATDPEVEEIIKIIQDYKGYQSVEIRSITDEAVRNYLAEKLNQIAVLLSDAEHHIEKDEDNNLREIFDHVTSGLKTIIESLHNPCYIKNDFFSTTQRNAFKFSQLTSYDMQSIVQVEILNDESSQITDAGDDGELEDILNHLYDLIDGLNQTLTEREFVIMGE